MASYTVRDGKSVVLGFRIKEGDREAYEQFARKNGFASFASMAKHMAEKAYEMAMQRGASGDEERGEKG